MSTPAANIEKYLKNPGNGLQDAVRVRARRILRQRIGSSIYISRQLRTTGPTGNPPPTIPKHDPSNFALLIRPLSTLRWNDVSGEPDCFQPIIELLIVGKISPHIVEDLGMNQIRLALANYRGTLGDAHCEGSTVERDGMPVANRPVIADDRWRFGYSMDIRFTFEQVGI